MTTGRSAFRTLGKVAKRRLRRLRHPGRFIDLSGHARVRFDKEAVTVDTRLYDDGGFYDVPNYLLKQSRNAVSCRELFPGYGYHRPEPELLGAEEWEPDLLEEYGFQDEKLQVGPAVLDVALIDMVLLGSTLYEVSDGTITGLWETCREIDRTVQAPITGEQLSWVEVVESEERDFVFLGSPGSFNYSHWLIDDLSRLPVPAVIGPKTTYILQSHSPLMNERRVEGLRLLLQDYGNWDVHFLHPHQPYFFRRLRFTTPPTYHPCLMSPHSQQTLRARVEAALGPDPSRPKRVFLGRGGSTQRGLLNYDAVLDLLRPAGFHVVDPLETSSAGQLSACLGAEVVVGVMGAAMANAIVSAPGTRVIHLSPRGWLDPFFWNLAAVAGHDYTAIYGDTEGEGAPWTRSFRIDVDDLRMALV